jgi:hypothetical protein
VAYLQIVRFVISGAKSRKSLIRAFWDWICRFLEPEPESHQFEFPGNVFVDFWSHDQKVTKSRRLGLALSTFGVKVGKSSHGDFWDWGIGCVDFWIQGRKVVKWSLLGLVLSTSGAKARKSSNRDSKDWYC